VTDDKDRRLLMSLLNKFYNEDAINVDKYEKEKKIYPSFLKTMRKKRFIALQSLENKKGQRLL
jgi:hypothetical protein